LYNAINAVAAMAAAAQLGVDPSAAAGALAEVEAAFGRVERVTVDGRHLYLLLIKNPTGFNQVLQTFLAGKTERRVLMLINDNFADGRDVSWLWDVGFEDLAGLEHRIVAGGIRGADLALRLKYAGIPSTVEDDTERAIAQLVDSTPPGETAYLLPTYTAMLEVRRLLGRHQELRGIWE
jgi:UDP-N-acetylmuramyl tripeptide synthase